MTQLKELGTKVKTKRRRGGEVVVETSEDEEEGNVCVGESG